MANPIIKIKRGEYLENSQAVLANGEPCYDNKKHRLYVGDGVNPISNLPYFSNSINEWVDWTKGYKLTIPSTGSKTSYVRTTYNIDWNILDEYFGYINSGVVLRVRHDSNSSISTVPYFAVGVTPADGVTPIGDVQDSNGIIWICHFSSYTKSGQMLSSYCTIPRSDQLSGTVYIDHRATDLSYAWLHPLMVPEFPESSDDTILP